MATASNNLDSDCAVVIKRRIDDIESGAVKCVPWNRVERELQQIIDAAKARRRSARTIRRKTSQSKP